MKIKKEHIGTLDKYLDFGMSEYGDEEFRNELRDEGFKFVDFDKSNFKNCNLTKVTFENCNFSFCDFTEIRQWNCTYNRCIFSNSKFNNATMGVDVAYSNCSFDKCRLNGKCFSFGYNAKFRNCSFEGCDIKSTSILSVTFKDCFFSSTLTNVRLSGEVEAKVSTKNGQLQFPATFVNCDLSNSTFIGVEIMDGAILVQTVLPVQNSERFNNDRIYFP